MITYPWQCAWELCHRFVEGDVLEQFHPCTEDANGDVIVVWFGSIRNHFLCKCLVKNCIKTLVINNICNRDINTEIY